MAIYLVHVLLVVASRGIKEWFVRKKEIQGQMNIWWLKFCKIQWRAHSWGSQALIQISVGFRYNPFIGHWMKQWSKLIIYRIYRQLFGNIKKKNYKITTSFVENERPKGRVNKKGINVMILHFTIRKKLSMLRYDTWFFRIGFNPADINRLGSHTGKLFTRFFTVICL